MLNKEEIVKVFKYHAKVRFINSFVHMIDKDDWDAVAEEILSLQEPNDDTPPQLNKHDVSGRSEQLMPADSELKQIFLNKYNCFTEGATDDGWKSEPAMTVDRFIEAVKFVTGSNC